MILKKAALEMSRVTDKNIICKLREVFRIQDEGVIWIHLEIEMTYYFYVQGKISSFDEELLL